MTIELVLDRAIDRRPAVRLGPLSEIRLTHRRLRAGTLEVVRHVDGGWHFDDGVFLEVRLETSRAGAARRIQIDFGRPWAQSTPATSGQTARLYGDRLFLEFDRWVASDDEDSDCWVSEETGLANEELRVSAM